MRRSKVAPYGATFLYKMNTRISYLDFARPFKYNRDFYVLCHLALSFFAEENNIQYVNNVKEKCYEFKNASDLLKIRFDFNEDMLREYWHKFVEENDGNEVVNTFKDMTLTLGLNWGDRPLIP